MKRHDEESVDEPAPKKAQVAEVLTINVGGRLFTTTRKTLVSDPESMLAKLFDVDSKFGVITTHEGNPFIDRSGDSFSHVLEFLRDPEAFQAGFESLTSLDCARLYVEAKYYQVTTLLEFLEQQQDTAASEEEEGAAPIDESVTLLVRTYHEFCIGERQATGKVSHLLQKTADGKISLFQFKQEKGCNKREWNSAVDDDEWVDFDLPFIKYKHRQKKCMVRKVKSMPATASNCALLANWLLELTKKDYCVYDHEGSESSPQGMFVDFRVFDLKPVVFEAYPVGLYGKTKDMGNVYPWQYVYDDLHNKIKDEEEGSQTKVLKLIDKHLSARAYADRALAEVTSIIRSWEATEARVE